MPTYSYTHGSTSNLNRLRLLIGDHRGTDGVATNWLFSNEELSDILSLCNDQLLTACRVALQIRANREAMNAGVAGTTDTTDRPSAILLAIRSLSDINLTTSVPKRKRRSYEAPTDDLQGDFPNEI